MTILLILFALPYLLMVGLGVWLARTKPSPRPHPGFVCSAHGRQLALLNGKPTCFACHVERRTLA